MLGYAVKLTRQPGAVRELDVEELRLQGFSDRAILEINAAVAYMNFVNRVAEGLGVELEPSLEPFTR